MTTVRLETLIEEGIVGSGASTAADVTVAAPLTHGNVQAELEAASGLPSQWTDGGNGDVTATTDEGATAPALTVKATAAQTATTNETNLTEVLDHDGNLLWATEFDGGTRHVWDIRVQPIDGPTVFAVSPVGNTLWGNADGVVSQLNPSGGDPLWLLNAQTGQMLMQLYGDPTGAKDTIRVYGLPDFDPVMRVLSLGGVVIAQNVAPGDGDINAGDMALWFDSTNGAAKLMIKGKSADGTVVTGSVNLS